MVRLLITFLCLNLHAWILALLWIQNLPCSPVHRSPWTMDGVGWVTFWLGRLSPSSCLRSSFGVLCLWQCYFVPSSALPSATLLRALFTFEDVGTKLPIFFSVSIEEVNAFLDNVYNGLVYKTLISSVLHPWLQHSHPLLGLLLRNLHLQYSPLTIISFHLFYPPIFSPISS